MSAKPESAAPAAEAPAEGAPKAKGGGMLPLILVVVLSPALSWAVAQFVLLPALKKEIAAATPAPAADGEHGPAEEGAHGAEPAAEEAGGHEAKAAAGHGAKKEAGGHGGKSEGAGNTFRFENVVVNLAGTMGTRYLKTTFMVSGKDVTIAAKFEENRPQLLDVTLNVLSSLSLADLEEVGSKNLIRERLIVAYNQVLGKKIVEQIFFSDFVVQ